MLINYTVENLRKFLAVSKFFKSYKFEKILQKQIIRKVNDILLKIWENLSKNKIFLKSSFNLEENYCN